MAVETSERTDGPTPNGGTYAIAYWFDSDRNPATKEDAVFTEIHEFDADGEVIHRTYLDRNNPQDVS